MSRGWAGSVEPVAAGGETRREKRRQQILDCARDAFVDKGYEATTVDDIVARVQVARGTFYLYFQDKRAVFEALLDDFFGRIASTIRSIDLSEGAPAPREQLRDNLRRIVELALAEPGMVKLALRTAPGTDPDLDARLGKFYRALHQFMDESLAEGQGIGLVREGDGALMVSLDLGGLEQILVDVVTGELERDAEELTAAMMQFLEGGLLGPNGSG